MIIRAFSIPLILVGLLIGFAQLAIAGADYYKVRKKIFLTYISLYNLCILNTILTKELFEFNILDLRYKQKCYISRN